MHQPSHFASEPNAAMKRQRSTKIIYRLLRCDIYCLACFAAICLVLIVAAGSRLALYELLHGATAHSRTILADAGLYLRSRRFRDECTIASGPLAFAGGAGSITIAVDLSADCGACMVVVRWRAAGDSGRINLRAVTNLAALRIGQLDVWGHGGDIANVTLMTELRCAAGGGVMHVTRRLERLLTLPQLRATEVSAILLSDSQSGAPTFRHLLEHVADSRTRAFRPDVIVHGGGGHHASRCRRCP